METETTAWSGFPNGKKPTTKQRFRVRPIDKSKLAGIWELLSGIRVR